MIVFTSLAGAFYNAHNATRPGRFSEFDVVPAEGEPDPSSRPSPPSGERPDRYCSRCGAGLRLVDKFCSNCGGRADG